jgi:multidrug efflux pump subunit AcrA (membrane-fusion protein)
MFATVSLATDNRAQVLTVPSSAVGEEGRERFVFVQENEGYERRKVRVGRTDGANIEILKGLTAGDRVVTEGLFVLKSEAVKAELKGHDH